MKIDPQDRHFLTEYKWHKGQYITHSRWGKKPLYLHRLITDAPEGVEVDHINGDKLDNRRSNLRLVNSSQNKINRGLLPTNTSGYTGISWGKNNKKWETSIWINNKRIRLGYFVDLQNAIQARKLAEEEYFGEFRRTNYV